MTRRPHHDGAPGRSGRITGNVPAEPVYATEEPMTTITDRYTALFGSRGWRGPLAEALGYSAASRVSEALAAERTPPILVVAVEFLEATPPRDWPERWHELRRLFVRA